MFTLIVIASLCQLIDGYAMYYSDSSPYTDNYCNKTLCLRWKKDHWVHAHNIACNNRYGYSSFCPSNAEILLVEEPAKQLVVHLHNKHRNKIANGRIRGYEPARRMTTMIWDNELAYLAQLNCFRCYYGADQCRNTIRYPHVGQNIDLYWSSKGYLSESVIINRVFGTWFREYSETGMNMIRSYYNNGRVVGHFTQIVSEKSAAVGCALIRWHLPHESHQRYYMYFVCNYSFTNYDKLPVYSPGETGSACTTGYNPDYYGLCSVNEYVPPIPTFTIPD